MNNVTLEGRLTKDPVSTEKVSRFTLAVQGYKDADFVPCVAFSKNVAEANMHTKGGLCKVTGRLMSGSYTNKEGVKVYTLEVVIEKFL